ncbi:MAG: DUF1800 family protein, partial [Planctomycetota bacterium]|nr:DUF1800 family protein [Planctomycetota bacterium]
MLSLLEVLTQPQGPDSPFGTTAGGDRVRLIGTGFLAGMTVTVGGAAATIESITPTATVIVTPSGPAGFADIAVTVPGGGGATLPGVFQYIAPPSLFSVMALDGPTVNESRAPIAGGGTMQLSGQNFRAPMELLVDGALIAATVIGPTEATFTVPRVAEQSAVDLVITTPEGMQATLFRGLVYTQEFSLEVQPNALSTARATHLYRRAGFGATPEAISAAVARGIAGTVQLLMDFQNDVQVERDAMTAYGTLVLPTNLGVRPNKEWWIHLMLKNSNPLQERIAFFLHEHFATSERDMNSFYRWTLHEQINLFRRFTLPPTQTLDNGQPGLGWSWARLLKEIGKDRAMLDWLDGRVSQKGAPNENYARELWELFMLGEGVGYT